MDISRQGIMNGKAVSFNARVIGDRDSRSAIVTLTRGATELRAEQATNDLDKTDGVLMAEAVKQLTLKLQQTYRGSNVDIKPLLRFIEEAMNADSVEAREEKAPLN